MWRSPNDNDKGGGKWSFAYDRKQAGLDKATLQKTKISFQKIAPHQMSFTIEAHLEGKKDTGFAHHNKAVYTVLGNGEIKISQIFKGDMILQLPPLAKIGAEIKLLPEFYYLKWFGRGQ